MERSLCFLDNAVLVLEFPVLEQNKPEVKEAQVKEMKNLEDYETFQDVEDVGQGCIGICQVITRKEKHDRDKTEFKSRLLARGFQEMEKTKSYSPTVEQEILILLMALAVTNSFELSSIDKRAACLQKKTLDREVF